MPSTRFEFRQPARRVAGVVGAAAATFICISSGLGTSSASYSVANQESGTGVLFTGAFRFGPSLSVDSPGQQPNDIVLRRSGRKGVVVEDSQPVFLEPHVEPPWSSAVCRSLDVGRVVCRSSSEVSNWDVSVRAGAGGDRVKIALPTAPRHAYVDGGPGRDLLRGWAGDDELDGGTGRDALYGGGGSDWLRADGSRNRFYGGRGSDRIDAFRNDAADRVIDCGSGKDTAFVDRFDPRPAKNCENVKRKVPRSDQG
jgi:hypothetical protein